MSQSKSNKENDTPSKSAEQSHDNNTKPTLSETDVDIQTADGKHRLSADSPVRIGNFGAVGKYHTTYCRYVGDSDIEDIKPMSDGELEYHTNMDECKTCERNRNDTETKTSNGDRSWYKKASDPDYN